MLLSYASNGQSVSPACTISPVIGELIDLQVMLIERSVDGTPLDHNDQKFERSKDTSLAERFLMSNDGARIVVVVDTHCLDNGRLVWTGTSADEYRACSLFEVSSILCTP
jgi:hypothetical protein